MSQSLEETSQSQMQSILDRQRAAYLAEGIVTSETRIDRLERAVRVLKKHQKAFVQAMNEGVLLELIRA